MRESITLPAAAELQDVGLVFEEPELPLHPEGTFDNMPEAPELDLADLMLRTLLISTLTLTLSLSLSLSLSRSSER